MLRAEDNRFLTESGAGTAFLATPHEFSAEIAPKLIDAGIRVIDLSGASLEEHFSESVDTPERSPQIMRNRVAKGF